MTGREYQFFHSDNSECDYHAPLEITNVCLFVNATLVIFCKCPKCGKDDFRFPHELKDLYKFCLQMRKDDGKKKQPPPLKPPIAIAPPKFTEQDIVEAHGLGIIIPPDEAA